jgi:Holliday junction resolvase-like predicted endonuclease
MALLAEELVEEWLNRQGYFTIRGVKLGVHEIDLLAIRPESTGKVECRHIEVQASVRPVSYITQVPKSRQRDGIAANSAKDRSDADLRLGVSEWISKKFDHPEKRRLRLSLYEGDWSRELVVHRVKHQREIELLRAAGLTVHSLTDVLSAMGAKDRVVESASGGYLLDLVGISRD